MAIILDDTDKTLVVELVESPTTQPDYVITYADHSTGAFTEGALDGTLADATTTTICTAPAASTRRVVKHVSIYNADASAITVLVKYDHNGTRRVLKKQVVAAGSTLTFDGNTWTVVGSTNAWNDGWQDASDETWAWVDADDDPTYSMSIVGDVTGKYQAGYRIKLTQTTVKYFIVTAAAYAAGTGLTTLKLYGGTDYNLTNAAISSKYFSNVKSPFGFPMDPTKWTVLVYNDSSNNQAAPVTMTYYNVGSVSISVPIGAWVLGYQASVAINGTNTANYAGLFMALSTSSNSVSDAYLRSFGYSNVTNKHWYFPFHREVLITVAAKTVYYAIIASYITLTSPDYIGYYGGYSATYIWARCAYL